MKLFNSFLTVFYITILLCFNLFAEDIASPTSEHSQKTIVVITPHPDDAEASCGGLIANCIANGDDVIILNMTGGEYGIWNKSPEEARSIRTIEAKNAGEVLGAKEVFFGGIDAHLNVDSVNTEKLKRILLDINPDIVLSSWPMDVHSDHQATGILAWRVFQDPRFNFELFFYETTNTPHTKTYQFVPTHYVDISEVMELKKEATLQHKSQNPIEWYYMYETLAEFRGYESDVKFAEAYIRAQNSSGLGGRSGTTSKTLDNALKQAK
jgi:N-acetylglucosamine malate deacetylase 1